MSIYLELLEAVSNGKRFKIDLVNKSLTIDKKKIIEKGAVLDEAKELITESDVDQSTSYWDWIEWMYDQYKYSVPSEKSRGNQSYFKAVNSDQLSLEQMVNNEPRDYTQARLEGYILLASLVGWLKWNNDNHWFWQSDQDKKLVILKQWI